MIFIILHQLFGEYIIVKSILILIQMLKKKLITKGKLCNAGHTYALIHPDGEVLSCGGATREGKQVILGNIFDPNFNLRISFK